MLKPLDYKFAELTSKMLGRMLSGDKEITMTPGQMWSDDEIHYRHLKDATYFERPTAPPLIGAIEDMIKRSNIKIKYNDEYAHFDAKELYIGMPPRSAFKDSSSYYKTLFHEMTHATGYDLGRLPILNEPPAYAFEEMIAELGSVFLCEAFDLNNAEIIDHSAGYIMGYMTLVRDPANAYVKAAGKARMAAHHLLEKK